MTQVTEHVQPLTSAVSAARRVRAISELPGPRKLPLRGTLLKLASTRSNTIRNTWADDFWPMYPYRAFTLDAVVISYASWLSDLLRNRPEAFRPARRMQAIVLAPGGE